MYCVNVGGLRTKINDLVKLILCSQYDILVFLESWLSDDFSDAELAVDSFKLFRCDRSCNTSSKSRGGGVLVYIRDNISAKRLRLVHNSVEQLYLLCKLGSKEFVIGGVYIPPKSDIIFYERHCQTVEILKYEYAYCDFYVFGDFNIPNAHWENDERGVMVECTPDSPGLILGQSYAYLNFFQKVTIPNDRNVFLDLVFTNKGDLLVSEAADSLFEGSLNHKAYCFQLDLGNEPMPTVGYIEFYYDFRNADYIAINNYLGGINWDLHLNSVDIDLAASQFYHVLSMAIALFVPLKRFKTSQFPRWFSSELRYLVTQKKIAHKKYCTSHNVVDYIAFSELRSRCKILTDICYRDYISNLDRHFRADPKSFWYYINSRRSVNEVPNSLHFNDNSFVGCEKIADGFAQFFSNVYNPNKSKNCPAVQQESVNTDIPNPKLSVGQIYDKISKLRPKLSSGPDGVPNYFLVKCICTVSYPLFILFQKSLDLAVFPTVWKHSFVVPIFKSGDNTNIENYRSVCIQSAIPKLFDSIIYDQIYFHCKELLLSQQHGFSSGRSTVTNLLIFQQYLLGALEKGYQVDVIYTDFSKAFDSVDHGILLRKLGSFGFSNHMIHWFASSLSGLTQQVRIGNAKSSYIKVCSGVPQGGHCSPLLFNIFINDICNCFQNSEFLLFADDLKFYRIVLNLGDQILLQSDLNRLKDWCESNNLLLNINKCNYVSFHRRNKKIESSYSIGQSSLQYCNAIKDLGIYFDDQLNFNTHINKIVLSSSKVLGFVLRNGRGFSVETCKSLYMALVVSLLEYGSMIWSPYYMNSCLALERVQNKFVRYCLFKLNIGIPQDHMYDNALQILNMKTLKQRRLYRDLTFVFKLLNGLITCPELLGNICFNIPSRILRQNRLFSLPFHGTNYAVHSPIERTLNFVNCNNVDILGISLSRFKRHTGAII